MVFNAVKSYQTTSSSIRALSVRLLILFLGMLLLAGQTSATETPKIVQSASEYDYPPFSEVDKKNQADGFSVELLQAALHHVGRDVNFKVSAWSELKEDLEHGRLQVLPVVARTTERQKIFDFTFPYMSLHGTIVTRKEDESIKQLSDLEGKAIVVMQSDSAEDYVKEHRLSTNIVTTKSVEIALKGLSEGKYDAMIVQKLVAENLISKLALNNLKTVGQPIEHFQDLCFAVHKGDDELLAELNEGLSLTISDGTFERLREKWFMPSQDDHWTRILEFLGIFVGTLLIAWLAASLWQRSLVAKVKSRTHELSISNQLQREEIQLRKRTESLLRESESLFHAVFDNATVGIAQISVDGQFLQVNQEFCRITGRSRQEILSSHSISVQDFIVPDFGSHPISANDDYAIEKQYVRKNEEIIWISLSVCLLKDQFDKPLYFISAVMDITERKSAETEILSYAYYDQLTQLPNRRLFQDRLDFEFKKAEKQSSLAALLFIDLDHFKEVNDTLGHDMGDLLLIEAARRIQQCIQPGDTLARIGGDEFTVVLTDCYESSNIKRVAQSIIDHLSEPFILNGNASFVSGTIGIAIYPQDASTMTDLMRSADQAMYAAKNLGRGCYCFFTDELQKQTQFRAGLERDLREALEFREFEVYYQPIIDLQTGDIHKAEALIRWKHPIRGFVSPAEFIPIAEEIGLIQAIGKFVFVESIQQLKRLKESFQKDFQISVNMSPLEFRVENKASDYWKDCLREADVAGSGIIIEITEGLLMNTEANIIEKLLSFRDSGVQVSIDDFGTGYSSLAYLKKFNVDYLKIDISFVRNLVFDPRDLHLCEAIVLMAHRLGIKVVAEGVETKEQEELLKKINCDYAQGYLFSKPIPAVEFERFLASPPALNAS